MEISKAPPAEAAAVLGSRAAAQQPAPRAAPAVDLADIRPLDVASALQILLAEVRAELDSMLETAIAPSPAAGARGGGGAAGSAVSQSPASQSLAGQNPLEAARALVEMYLKALPEDANDAQAWSAAWVRLDDAMQASFERAAAVVMQWRDVSPFVVNATQETQTWFVAVLRDDAENSIWLRPEWLGLAPAFNRFHRRRRNARRRLADPDYARGSLDDDSEETGRRR